MRGLALHALLSGRVMGRCARDCKRNCGIDFLQGNGGRRSLRDRHPRSLASHRGRSPPCGEERARCQGARLTTRSVAGETIDAILVVLQRTPAAPRSHMGSVLLQW
jgi:hypothetical protein